MRSDVQLFLLLLLLNRAVISEEATVAEEGFCTDNVLMSKRTSKSLYWKVTNPTLSPTHLEDGDRYFHFGERFWQRWRLAFGSSITFLLHCMVGLLQKTRDLPGFTRSVYRRDHALISPESQVFSLLPNWVNALGAYLISPALGSHFTMYLLKMQEDSRSALPAKGIERFIFVLEGSSSLSDASGITHQLEVDFYAYIPANSEHLLKSNFSATLVIFERRYVSQEGFYPEEIIGSTDNQPLLDTPGEVFELRKLLPTSLAYDFNIHIMDFQPGEYLNVKEVHYNQHGLLLLEGQGIYRLGDNWYPVQTGDSIWMAPFVPQWYAALGKTRSRYLLYKDVNRDPL